MGNWLTDNWLGVAGIVIGVTIALVVYWRQKRPKRLDYEVVNDVPILASSTKNLGDDLKVDYKGQHLLKPHILTIRIINTGKRAVRGDDYDTPVVVAFKDSTITSVLISRTADPHIRPEINNEIQLGLSGIKSNVEVEPGLLNPGEWFDVQLLNDGAPSEIDVRSRFADQDRQMGLRPAYKASDASAFPTFGTLLLGYLVAAYMPGVLAIYVYDAGAIWIIWLTLVSLGFVTASALFYVRVRKRFMRFLN